MPPFDFLSPGSVRCQAAVSGIPEIQVQPSAGSRFYVDMGRCHIKGSGNHFNALTSDLHRRVLVFIRHTQARNTAVDVFPIDDDTAPPFSNTDEIGPAGDMAVLYSSLKTAIDQTNVFPVSLRRHADA